MPARIETLDCPRCRKRHEQKFIPFRRSAGPWTHWGMCHATLEPIMMMSKPMGVWDFIRRLGETGILQVCGIGRKR